MCGCDGQEDFLLECVMLLATVTNGDEAAQLVAKSDLPRRLCDVLLQKDIGEDILLQVLYTLNQ
jgi:hypothetical protein